MPLAQRQRRRGQLLVARPPMADRRAAALLQPLRAFRRIARQPFVAGLAADPERGANLRHHRLVLTRRNHKSHPLVHRAGLTPRHRRGPPRRAIACNDVSGPIRQRSYRIVQPQEELAEEDKRRALVGHRAAEDIRYNERSGAERVNANLKDNHGGRTVQVRGPAKVMCHLMFGILVITVSQIIRLIA